MKTKYLAVVLGVLAFGALHGCTLAEPPSVCQIGLAGLGADTYWVEYTRKSDTPSGCWSTTPLPTGINASASGTWIEGWSTTRYGRPLNTFQQNQAAGMNYDIGITPDAITDIYATGTDTSTCADLDSPASGCDDPVALGNLTSYLPDSNSLCSVSTFTVAAQTGLSYTISNLQILDDAYTQGAELTADVTINNTAGGCSGDFVAVGLYPQEVCINNSTSPASFGGDAYCASNVDTTTDFLGSGLLPTLPIHCDANTAACIIKQSGSFPYTCLSEGQPKYCNNNPASN